MSSIKCNLCEETDINPNQEWRNARAHWESCSLNERQIVRDRLKSSPDDDTLKSYHAAKAQVYGIKEAVTAPPILSLVQAARIFRMWRANELLGRSDYLPQLVQSFRSCGDGKDDQSKLQGWVNAVILRVLQEHNDILEVVMAIEDAFYYPKPSDEKDDQVNDKQLSKRLTERPYSAMNEDNVLQNDGQGPIPQELVARLSKKHLRGRMPIDSLTDYYNSVVGHFTTPRPRVHLVLAKLALSSQLEEVGEHHRGPDAYDDPTHWTDEQDDVLLKLMATCLPMVELTRNLNAELTTRSDQLNSYGTRPEDWSVRMPIRTEDLVKIRIDQLLILP